MIGGEASGGIGVKGHLHERDGVVLGLVILDAKAPAGKPMDDLIEDCLSACCTI